MLPKNNKRGAVRQSRTESHYRLDSSADPLNPVYLPINCTAEKRRLRYALDVHDSCSFRLPLFNFIAELRSEDKGYLSACVPKAENTVKHILGGGFGLVV